MRWLVRRAEFQAAAKGRRAHAPPFTLQMRRRAQGESQTDAPRFGLTATRKIGGAVERNRMKRRLRAALRDLGRDGGEGFGQSGHDYVVVLRRESLTAPFEGLLSDLKRTMRKAHEPRARAQQEPRPGAHQDHAPPPAGETATTASRRDRTGRKTT